MGYHEVQPPAGGRPTAGATALKAYAGDFMAAGAGVNLGFNWNALSWKIGDHSYSDQAWAPQASLAYGVSDTFDIRATAKFSSGQDTVDDAASDISVSRFGVGTRAWFHTGADFIPFVGMSANYYALDVKEGSNPEGMFGLSGEAGIAYVMNEWVAVEASLHAETSLNDGSVLVGGETEGISLQSAGIGLGITVLF
jgi:hypothetical protein